MKTRSQMIDKQTYKVLGILLFLFCFSCSNKDKVPEVVLRPVKYAKVSYFGGDKVRNFSGTAKTEKIVNLSFRSSGIIVKLDMKLGQLVKKGELLGQLDNVQARLNYESAIETKNSSESQMNTAKLNLNRIRILYEKGSSSLSDYEVAKDSYRTSVASFESSKRSVAIQKDQIQFGYLYASEDGAIASVSAEVDENVTPGQVIGVLNAGTAIEIKLGLPESVINSVKKDMTVIVSFTALEGQTFNAVVTEVAPALDRDTSTYPVTVMVTDSNKNIKSGMAANVTFNFKDSDTNSNNYLIVPVKAVGKDGKSNFVFVIESSDGKTGLIKKQSIKIGELTSSGFEIKTGLSAGDKIATAGLQTLLDGQKVRLQ